MFRIMFPRAMREGASFCLKNVIQILYDLLSDDIVRKHTNMSLCRHQPELLRRLGGVKKHLRMMNGDDRILLAVQDEERDRGNFPDPFLRAVAMPGSA